MFDQMYFPPLPLCYSCVQISIIKNRPSFQVLYDLHSLKIHFYCKIISQQKKHIKFCKRATYSIHVNNPSVKVSPCLWTQIYPFTSFNIICDIFYNSMKLRLPLSLHSHSTLQSFQHSRNLTLSHLLIATVMYSLKVLFFSVIMSMSASFCNVSSSNTVPI